MFTWVLVFLQRLLAQCKLAEVDDVDGVLEGSKMILYQNSIAPGLNVLLADLGECDFDGYVRSTAITWGSVFVSTQTGLPTMPGDLKTFVCDGGEDQVISGYALVSADVTPVLLGYRPFLSQITITDGGAVSIIPRAAFSMTAPLPDTDPQLS